MSLRNRSGGGSVTRLRGPRQRRTHFKRGAVLLIGQDTGNRGVAIQHREAPAAPHLPQVLAQATLEIGDTNGVHG
jgi:hypothetical protein